MEDINRRKRVREIRKKRKRRLLFLLVFIPLFIFLINKSEILNLKEIVVNNNKKVEKDDIVLISGLEKGENIFNLQLDKAAREINSLPYIELAHVNRKLPNKVVIDVLEREAKMQLSIGDKYQKIDRYGYVLSEEDEKDSDLLILENVDKKKFKLASNFYQELGSEEIKSFFEEIDRLNLYSRIDKIDFEDKQGIELVIDGRTIYFGDLYDSSYKVKLLNEVLIDIEGKDLDYKEIRMDRGDNPIIILNDEDGG